MEQCKLTEYEKVLRMVKSGTSIRVAIKKIGSYGQRFYGSLSDYEKKELKLEKAIHSCKNFHYSTDKLIQTEFIDTY